MRGPIVKREAAGKANVTSLVDIALSLVIYFLVAIPFLMESGVFVSSPSATVATAAVAQEILVNIYITDQGDYYLNNTYIDNLDKLANLVKELMKRSKDKLVVVKADDDTKHEYVVKALDIAKRGGAERLMMLRAPKKQQGG